MKILKIFGLVAGIHVFALILIFANPGCSSSTKPVPAPVDTVANSSPPPSSINLPLTPTDSPPAPMASAPITFDPNAPAVASSEPSGGRYMPTRPGTPVASTLVTAPVGDVTPATTYTVKSGDTLWELGKKFHVPYAEIASANNIRASAPLRAGQKLIIPGKAGTSPAPAASTAAAAPTKAPAPAASGAGTMKHTVRPNETLSTIARTYGVKSRDIAVANNISDPQKIRAGTELIIPGWQGTAPAAKSSASSSSRPTTETPRATPPATPAPAPIINILDAEPATPANPPSGEVPVIRVEDNPMSAAPKGN